MPGYLYDDGKAIISREAKTYALTQNEAGSKVTNLAGLKDETPVLEIADDTYVEPAYTTDTAIVYQIWTVGDGVLTLTQKSVAISTGNITTTTKSVTVAS